MNIIGIITARAGSKRLPGKNLKPLGEMPLIAWSIKSATESGCFDRIIVSTEDEAIAGVAKGYGAEVPWLRSAELATDKAKVEDALLQVISRIKADGGITPDGVMLLQPTSPFRSAKTIKSAIKIFSEDPGKSVVSVSPSRTHPFMCKEVDELGVMRPFDADGHITLRSQDLPPVYELNGLIYLVPASFLMAEQSLYTKDTRALIVNDMEERLDIDTPLDWALAETILEMRRREGR